MIDYSKWPRKKFSVTSLFLDVQNPRLSGFGNGKPSPKQIIDYLIEHESILALARDISIKGFLPNEEPIVYRENNKFVVLEGNRRVSACKILLDPKLISVPSKKKTVEKMLAFFDSSFISKLAVIVAPSREAADIIIVNRHTKGSAIEKWDKTKQDRFFYNRSFDGETIEDMALKFNLPKSAIKDSIIRYNIFEELIQLPLTAEDKVALSDETKLSMTNIERFYKSKCGKDFLGLDFNKSGLPIHHLPKEEYQKRITRVATDVIKNKLNSRTYGNESQQKEFINNLKKESVFDWAIQANKSYEEQYSSVIADEDEMPLADETPDKTPGKKTPAGTPANRLFNPGLRWRIGNPRIDKIFTELKTAPLDTHFNSTAILFRSYLDMIVYQYLQKNDGILELKKLEQQKLDLENDKKITKLNSYLTELGVSTDTTTEASVKKVLGIKTGIQQSWVPSLRQMLVFLSDSDTLLPDIKLRQALKGYLNGSVSFLDHNDFNLLVHNEYVLKEGKDLKLAWDNMLPILEYLNKELSGNNPPVR